MFRRMSSRVSRNDDLDYRSRRTDDVDNRTRGGVTNQGFDSYGVGKTTDDNTGSGNNNRDNNRNYNRDNSRGNNRGVDNRAYLASGGGVLNFGSTDFQASNGGAPVVDRGGERINAASPYETVDPPSPNYENVALSSVKHPNYSSQVSMQQKPADSSGKFLKIAVAIGFVVVVAAIVVAAIILQMKIQNNDNLIKDMNSTIIDLQSQVERVTSENIQLKQQQSNTAKDVIALKSSTTSDLVDLRNFEKNMSKFTEDSKKVGQFAFKGLGYGLSVNDAGSPVLRHACKSGGSRDIFGCLLYCYELRGTDPDVDGVVIRRDDYTSCCCEKKTKTTKSDDFHLHYVLTYFE